MPLGRVVDNCLKDFFKVNDNRERLAPTGPLVDEVTPAPATKPEEVMPARPVRPEGASPDDNNPSQANWDRRQKWNG